jgi:hypothetical protein
MRKDTLFRNGVALAEPYVQHGPSPREETAEYLAKMGDWQRPFISYDSRYWGFLPLAALIGQVQIIYWSWDPETQGLRFGRVGMRPQ